MARCSHKPVISVAASFPVDHSKVEWGLTPNGSFISYGNDESTAATNRVGKGRWIRKHCAATASLLHHDRSDIEDICFSPRCGLSSLQNERAQRIRAHPELYKHRNRFSIGPKLFSPNFEIFETRPLEEPRLMFPPVFV